MFAESQVGAVFMIVADVIGKEPFQVMRVQGNDVIQQIAPTALDPAFGNPVLPRALK